VQSSPSDAYADHVLADGFKKLTAIAPPGSVSSLHKIDDLSICPLL